MIASTARPDDAVVTAALAMVAAHGVEGATIERIAEAAGLSRVTLHRRGITRAVILDAVAAAAAQRFERVIGPALTAPGDASERLDALWNAACAAADEHLQLLAAIFAGPDSPFHRHGGAGEIDTDLAFVAPIERLLRDGALDGSLSADGDPHDTAVLMFNAAMWTYVHLRLAHRWSRRRARAAVQRVLDGLARPRRSRAPVPGQGAAGADRRG